MSVDVTGTIRMNPFPRVGAADPLGQMIGVGTITGDATGGHQRVNWSLPTQNVYIVQSLTAESLVGADREHFYQYGTGVTLDGIGEVYGTGILGIFIQLRVRTFWEPPRFMSLASAGGTIDLFCEQANVNAEVFNARMRALVWERNAFLTVSPSQFVGFLR